MTTEEPTFIARILSWAKFLIRALRIRHRTEVLLLVAVAAFVMWFATTLALAGPLVGLAYAMFLAPAIVRRWNLPVFGFMLGFLGWYYYAHQPLQKWGMVAFWVLPIALTLHYVAQPIITWLMARTTKASALIVLPISVGAAEWLRPLTGVGNYNMYQVGTFLHDWPVLIQFADVVGGLGLSVLWMIPWAVLVDTLRWRLGESSVRPVKHGLVATLVMLVVVVGYGVARKGGGERVEGPRVAIVQPSLDHGDPTTSHQVALATVRLTDRMVKPGDVDLIVWPENAVIRAYPRQVETQRAVSALAARMQAPVLLGSQAFTPDGMRPTNTAFLVEPSGEITGRYNKIVMFPFTERRMFEFLRESAPAIYNFVVNLTEGAWGSAPDGKPGERVELIRLNRGDRSYSLFCPICYESGYPELARDATQRGAELFVNLSSEGWLGFASANNMMGVNILRAVENRTPMVRCGNTGISGFINSDGEVTQYVRGPSQRRLLEAGVAVETVYLDSRSGTVYSKIGGLLDPAWLVIWLGAVLALPILRRKRR